MFSNKINRETINFSLFSVGKLISILGSMIYTFVIGLYVLKITGSGMNFALTLMFGVLAIIIFNPIAGVIADRFNKKHLVIIMDSLNGLLFIGIYIISKSIGLSLTLIYISAFITTGLTTVFAIALDTAMPQIVSKDKLLSLNSIAKIIDSLGSIVGPIIGGMVYAFVNIEMFILVNGISFLISALIEILIDFDYNRVEQESNELITSMFEDFKSGISFIVKNQEFVLILLLFVTINFFISFAITVPLPYIITQELQLSATNYGVIESFFPMGMIIGALVIKKVINKVQYLDLLKIATFILAITMLLVGAPYIQLFSGLTSFIYMIYYALITLIFGVTISFIDIPIMYYLQTEIPEYIRGRVLSISIASAKIIAPIALIISGVLVDKIDVYILPIVGGLLLAIYAIILMRRKAKFVN